MFEYSCFISYRNPEHDLGVSFVAEFCEALAGELEQQDVPGLFFDQSQVRSGDIVDPIFASALCRSACMIAVANPGYFNPQRPYCAREYRAMELLEQRRLACLREHGLQSTHGLIVPVVYRGFERLPPAIRARRISADFSEYYLGEDKMSHNARFKQRIRTIAEYVTARHEELAQVINICDECGEFTLPEPNTLQDWLPDMLSIRPHFPRGRGQ